MNCGKKNKKQELIVVGKKEDKNCVERYFFKYAFPCAQTKVKLGSLGKEEYEKLQESFLNKDCPNKETLEKDFGAAFTRIKKLAETMNKDRWDFEVIKEYWERNHNDIIDKGDGMYGNSSEEFKDLCKIHEAEIIEKKGNSLIVKYGEKERIVSNFLVPDVRIGDKVRIHYGFAIEKIN